jgi:hypothetical protein
VVSLKSNKPKAFVYSAEMKHAISISQTMKEGKKLCTYYQTAHARQFKHFNQRIEGIRAQILEERLTIEQFH